MPKISIITTAYKHQGFIAQTIESILAQTYNDRELLIGDDSPDDATWNIIQDYVKRYPEKIKARHHNPNKGIVDNMNFLIQQSSLDTEYISFLEGDDKYLPNNLEEKIKVFTKYSSVALIYSDLEIIDKNSNITEGSWYSGKSPFGKLGYKEKVNIYQFAYLPSNIMSYSSSVIRKSILAKISGIRSLGIKNCSVSDRDFYIQIVSRYPSYYIQTPLLQYRRHDHNFSKEAGKIGYHLYLVIQYYLRSGEWNWMKTMIQVVNPFVKRNIHVLSRKIKIFMQLILPSSLHSYIFKKIYHINA